MKTPNKNVRDAEGCFAELGSLTAAMKAQEALAAAAIPSSVEKTEKIESSSHRGCAYGLRLSCQQVRNARTVLRAARISVKQWNTEE